MGGAGFSIVPADQAFRPSCKIHLRRGIDFLRIAVKWPKSILRTAFRFPKKNAKGRPYTRPVDVREQCFEIIMLIKRSVEICFFACLDCNIIPRRRCAVHEIRSMHIAAGKIIIPARPRVEPAVHFV